MYVWVPKMFLAAKSAWSRDIMQCHSITLESVDKKGVEACNLSAFRAFLSKEDISMSLCHSRLQLSGQWLEQVANLDLICVRNLLALFLFKTFKLL